MTQSDYLTPDEVIESFGGTLKRKTLANWRYLKQGPPFVRLGAKRILYRKSDIEEWLRRGIQRSAAPVEEDASSRREEEIGGISTRRADQSSMEPAAGEAEGAGALAVSAAENTTSPVEEKAFCFIVHPGLHGQQRLYRGRARRLPVAIWKGDGWRRVKQDRRPPGWGKVISPRVAEARFPGSAHTPLPDPLPPPTAARISQPKRVEITKPDSNDEPGDLHSRWGSVEEMAHTLDLLATTVPARTFEAARELARARLETVSDGADARGAK